MGRPRHGKQVKSGVLSLHVDPDLRCAIQRASEVNDRSLTLEVESRLRSTLASEPPPKARKIVTLRMAADLRQKLELSAALSGRSLTQETEARIARSFDEDALRRMIREEVSSVLRESRARCVEVERASPPPRSHIVYSSGCF